MPVLQYFSIFLFAALLLGTAALTQAATPVVIDNTDAGFNTLGSWA